MIHPHTRIIPEIQGLRAIAVVAVLVFHIWPGALPGGYVGVDVFFVISGYLITGSLLREFEVSGRIDVSGFYARRIRRLLPAAIFVSVAVAFSIPLFPQALWPDIVSSIVASALYVQNWFLASQAVDYLADDAKGPMNHFWSLSVEEQYYIVWPLLLSPVLHLARRTTLDPRAVFRWFVGAIGVGSLIYSVLLTPQNPGLAYFATTTRAWELALGGALAISQGKHAFPERVRAILGFGGICAIAVACFAYSQKTQFPGYAALLPTLAVAAVILSQDAQVPWSALRILGSRFFQYLGDISYSLYLWHWPIIVIYGEVTGRTIGLLDGSAIFLASCALAHISKVFVEDYFRTSKFSTGRTLAAGAACIVLLSAAGAAYLVQNAHEQEKVVAGGTPRGARAMNDPQYNWRDEDLSIIVPAPEKVKKDVPSIYASGCHQTQAGTEVLTCDYGRPGSKPNVVMIGDSHAGHLYPAFEEMAEKGLIYFRGISKSACLFSLTAIYHPPFKRDYTECLEWSRNVIDWLDRERPDIVLISQSPNYPMTALDGMAAAWSRLLEMGLYVQAIRSTPWMPFEPSRCVVKNKDRLANCAPLRSAVFRPDPTLMTATALKINTLDLSKYLCDAVHCPVVIGGVLVYRDRHHFTATFARTLAEAVGEQLSLNLTSRG